MKKTKSSKKIVLKITMSMTQSGRALGGLRSPTTIKVLLLDCVAIHVHH